MRKIVLYTYYIDEERFSQTSNLYLERETVDIGSRNEHELTFAVQNRHMYQVRIAIADKPGKVFCDCDDRVYRVWFDSPDRDRAIKAIGNYILDYVASERRTHESIIEILETERQQAIKFLESLPEE